MAPKAKPVAKKPGAKKAPAAVVAKPLYEKKARNFSIGQDVPPKRDVTRFVRWPRYIALQRQKRVLQRRLKVPPTVNQFRRTLDTATRKDLFKLARKYTPENRKDRRARLRKEAEAKSKDAKGAKTTSKANRAELKYGIQRVTRLIETKRAKLVMIAHDVEPLELVLWLPALCHKMEVPYVFVTSKSELGKLVGMKTATAVAFVTLRPEDQATFSKLADSAQITYNDHHEEDRKRWGGGQLGRRARVHKKKRA